MPKPVDDCVQSILADNPEMDESNARAICNSMHNRGVLEAWLDADPDPDGPAALAEFRNPGDIQRVEDGGGVRYKRVMLLSPGVWTDAGSETSVDYSADGIRASADNFVDLAAIKAAVPDWNHLGNDERVAALRELGDDALTGEIPINLHHGPALYGADSLDEVGTVPVDSIIVDDDGQMYGDIVLSGDSPQSETAIDLMDEVLEAAETPGERPPPVGPSVEIPADATEAGDNGLEKLTEAYFSGVGIVFNPASRPVELGTQARQRAVAMQADGEDGPVVYRHAAADMDEDEDGDGDGDGGGDSLMAALRHRWHMSNEGDPIDFEDMTDDELRRSLEAMYNDVGEIKAALQDGDEMAAVLDAVQEFASAGEDLSAGADAFRDWAAANSEIDEDVLDDVLSAYLQAVDADDLSETPVEQLQAWLADAAGEEGDGDEEEDEPEADMTSDELEAAKQVVGDVAEQLGDIKDMLTEYEDEHDARKDRMEELERRLADIEDEPVIRSLVDDKEEPFIDSDGDSDSPSEHEEVFL